MIRERRNKEKLAQYYKKFMEEGVLDPNVHPWVAASWRRCRALKLPYEKMSKGCRLSKQDYTALQKIHRSVIKFVDGLYEQSRQYFNSHNLSMLLLDENGYVLKNYAIPFYQHLLDDVSGFCLLEENIGTSSISIAREHNVPFLIFGPEMWLKQCHSGDACCAPICVDGQIRYLISFFSLDQSDLPYDLLLGLLMTMKYSLEQHLAMLEYWAVTNIIMEQLPASIFWLDAAEQIKFCNESARNRLEGKEKLADVFLNYQHLPVKKALKGQATKHREITWITQDRAYEDITTVMPVRVNKDVRGALVLSLSIEDLKMTIAHATGYSSRYSLYSMVGKSKEFLALQNKAGRVAHSNHNILLQGEPGTGKQRLAHGIHQAGARAAGPLIVVNCDDVRVEELDEIFFGSQAGEEAVAGKLELALGGTLFLDEVEKLPLAIGDKLADVLTNGILTVDGKIKKYDVRVIAACDSNLKRLVDKGMFSRNLYEMLLPTIIRVPPLRDRVEDIQVLAEHILKEMAARHKIPPKRLTPAASELLLSCAWPGNIKQLQGVIEQAFFHTSGNIIDAENIQLPGNSTPGKAWKYDKEAFIAAWKGAGGNVSKLASMLDVSRVTLYRYLKKYGLVMKNSK